MPTSWFFGLFERLRGSHQPGLATLAQRALIALLVVGIAAVGVTFAGYWKQMRAALAPSARVTSEARLRRYVACLITGRDSTARGTVDFILTSVARNKTQQVPIAMCAAIAVAIVSAAISWRFAGLESLRTPRTVVLWIPLVLGYWIVVGLYASFFIPTNLRAAWAFRVHARTPSISYWSGVRASVIAFAIGPVLAANAAIVLPLLGWRMACWHTAIVVIGVVLASQVACLAVRSVPFTHAYPPGHAKLKALWPLYVFGMYMMAYWPVRLELWVLDGAIRSLGLALAGVAAIAALEVIGRRTALRWTFHPDIDTDDPDAPTVLNLGLIRTTSGHS